MGDQLLALDIPQRVLQLHRLDEQIVFRIQPRRGHRRLEEETQPLLDSDVLEVRRALCQIHEEDEVEGNRRGKNGVAAEEIDLDLHGIT